MQNEFYLTVPVLANILITHPPQTRILLVVFVPLKRMYIELILATSWQDVCYTVISLPNGFSYNEQLISVCIELLY
jgi:hypothetical protein